MSHNDSLPEALNLDQKALDVSNGGVNTAVGVDSVGISPATTKRSKEIFLTQQEAKQKKLQKGYVLEPIIAKPADNQSLSQKRERKKSCHFGYSPSEEEEAPSSAPPSARSSSHSEHRHRPKPSSHGYNGAARNLAAVVAPVSNLPSQWVEKRKMLQARLKRLEAQLAKVREASSAGAVTIPSGAYGGSSRCATPPIEGGHALSRQASLWGSSAFIDQMSMDRRPSDASSPIPSKRKASLDRPRETKRLKPSDGDYRLVPFGRMRNAHQHCVKLLDTLMKDRASKAYFNTPVDYIALGIPLYPQIITHPMDLGTVKQRLEDGEYDSVEAWAADIRLVWSNAMTFNAEGNDVHECAKALSVSFDKMMKQFPKIAGAPLVGGGVVGGGGVLDGGGRQVLELKRTMEKLQQEVANLKSKPVPAAGAAAGTAAPKKKSSGTGGSGGARKTMTFEEKRALSLNINKLDNDKLAKVVEIIQKRKGNIVGESEEVEVDIDALDNQTLRELERYINGVTNPRPQAPSKAGGARSKAAAPRANGDPVPQLQLIPGAAGGRGDGGWAGKHASSDSDSESESDDDSDKKALGGWAAAGSPGGWASVVGAGQPGGLLQ